MLPVCPGVFTHPAFKDLVEWPASWIEGCRQVSRTHEPVKAGRASGRDFVASPVGVCVKRHRGLDCG